MKQRIFVLGSQGRLGAALIREWQKLNTIELVGLSRAELDFSKPESACAVLEKYQLSEGDFLLNTAAMTDVDRCEREPALAMTVNATTPGLLATYAAECGARFLQVSTDYVFDGILERPYCETDHPNPLSHYGASKLAGEEAVQHASPHHIIARVSWVFGPDRASFIDQILQRAFITRDVAAVDDKTSSPSYTQDLATWLTCFFNPKLGGIYHLCNSGSCSWREYGQHALEAAARHGMPVLTTSVAPLTLASMKNFSAARPQHTSLDTTKFATLYGKPLRSWQDAVEEYISLQPPTCNI